jgi:hypothetical protein
MAIKKIRDRPLKGHQVYCRECETATDHLVVHENSRNSDSDWPGMPWCAESQAVECQGCKTLSVLERAYEADEPPGEWRLIPRRERDVRHEVKSDMVEDLPSELAQMYRETIAALNHDLRVLAAGGIRALVDGICAAKEIEGGDVIVMDKGAPALEADGSPKTKFRDNLEGKINGLVEAGLITKTNADHLHSMRVTGNEALHELEQPTKNEIELALAIVEHVLMQVFHLDKIYAAMTQLRETRRKKKASKAPTNGTN